jgi:hypothetical protein
VAEAGGAPATQCGRAAPDASVGRAADGGIGLALDGAVADGDGNGLGPAVAVANGEGLEDGAPLGAVVDPQADSANAAARTAATRDRGLRGITAGLCTLTRVPPSRILRASTGNGSDVLQEMESSKLRREETDDVQRQVGTQPFSLATLMS